MRMFTELILIPLIVNVLSEVIAEWLVSKAKDKRDKLNKQPEHLEQVQKETPLVAPWVFFLCA